MITVYAIISEVNGEIYVGIAKDPAIRLKDIMVERIDIQKAYDLGRIVYREMQVDWPAARKREKYLKSELEKNF